MLKKIEKYKIKLYLVLVIILFVFVLYFSFKDNYKSILEALGEINILYLVIGIICVFISKYFIGLTTYYLAKKDKDNIKFGRMLQIALIYPFFAGITPSAIGGESFEIFYLKQSGISYGKATNITVQKFILYQISLIIINFIALILDMFTEIIPDTSLVNFAITLNFVINIAILGVLFLLVYNKKFNHFIMNKGLVFLHKIRVVKNLDKTQRALDDYLDSFDEGANRFRKDKTLFIELIIQNVLSLGFLMIAAYPIARSLDINSVSAVNLFVISVYTRMMCLLIVTPGASGAMEYCFIYLFNGLLGDGEVITYMFIWRFVTYYIPLIVGGVLAVTWKGDRKDE